MWKDDGDVKFRNEMWAMGVSRSRNEVAHEITIGEGCLHSSVKCQRAIYSSNRAQDRMLRISPMWMPKDFEKLSLFGVHFLEKLKAEAVLQASSPAGPTVAAKPECVYRMYKFPRICRSDEPAS